MTESGGTNPMANRRRRSAWISLMLGALVMTACGANRPSPAASPSAPAEATLGPAPEAARLAQSLQETASAIATLAPQLTQTEAMRPTEQARVAQTATVEAIAQATVSAQSMAEVVQGLLNSGVVDTAEGEYHRLPDLDASWAQIDHYDYLLSDYTPADFVARSRVEWKSASDRPDWARSGCGYVFRLNARGDHYLAYLGLDGRFYLYRRLNDVIERVGSWPYGGGRQPQGEADIMLVAEGPQMTFYVNGRQVHSLQDEALSDGYLGYSLISGTNKDFGTNCRMTDGELWVLKPG
jgi:hypothetical protein